MQKYIKNDKDNLSVENNVCRRAKHFFAGFVCLQALDYSKIFTRLNLKSLDLLGLHRLNNAVHNSVATHQKPKYRICSTIWGKQITKKLLNKFINNKICNENSNP